MELTGLSFENYKAFARRESLELKPLTVLIGRNSSGKSAICRLPLLLAAALDEDAQSPVELDLGEVDLGASFVDLIHNRNPHGAIGLGATFEDDKGQRVELWVKIQHFSEYEMQVVSTFELKRFGKPTLTLTRVLEDPRVTPGRYNVQIGETGPVFEARMKFAGLWPDTSTPFSEEAESNNIKEFRGELLVLRGFFLHAALEEVGYLGPFRMPPERHYRYPGGTLMSVGVGGSQAPALLGADLLRGDGQVVKAVGEWYREHLGGWSLDISKQGVYFAVILRSPDDPTVEVNLADVGTGLSQVLPLVVQRKFDALHGVEAPILEIVEQPELHLHPGAHGALADLYIQAARQPNTRFLVETHSENFLLRIRRRVAEGELDPERVALYWVDDQPRPGSQLKHIKILPNGEVTMWPKGVFSEDFEEVRAIRAAQRADKREGK